MSSESEEYDHLSSCLDYFQKGEWDIIRFMQDYSGVTFSDCGWGSCQYSMAKATFVTMTDLKAAGYDPLEIVGWGRTVDFKKLQRVTDIRITNAVELIRDDLDDWYTEYIEDCCDAEQEQDYIATLRRRQKGLSNVTTMDQVFESCKECAWDLWSAASRACKLIFGTDFEDVGMHKDPKRAIKAGSALTGLQCYLLVECGAIKDPHESFDGFDT